MDKAIIQTARELVMEYGVQSFSMDTLALRAGVSKPTIYRRWPTKDDLLSDVLGFAAEQTDIPDTGNTLADIHMLLESMLQSLGTRLGAPSPSLHKMFAGMLDAPQFLAQYKENFIAPRRNAYSEIVKRGKRRGDIREDLDVETLVDLISGAYLYCLLFKPETVASGDWLQQVMRLLEDGVSPRD
ncbi:TetR/AcrR family transcriptional regulator [Paenibacillus aceris]|uniref:AcrR family transcriptional regulator n=1 Tax=Paenibacillus aceris TaxID=869555 RepID=A0ABS4HYK9_9BACL|nr:TetR/AcrR family transcriptional regulator [Paenibacillus aceris]MBP1963560.1 AcrR family transcriptional regulator [Paenibacillus aceris]NHW36824.1 TetR/AcrR family transcriptional regulator [Paenibacillus aceris]